MNDNDILLTDSIADIASEAYSGYLSHALCLKGRCSFRFNNNLFELREGDLMIVRKCSLFEDFEASDDFEVINLMVMSQFIALCTPQTNYGTKGQLALFLNPVMHLNPVQFEMCRRDFDWIGYRLSQTGHRFRHELLVNAVQSAILDFFHFHSMLNPEESVSTQNAQLMNRFLEMLENGEYRRHREVTYYADRLCITPKYLSEVSKKLSGYAANYWINRYTILGISRMLRDKSMTFVAIADELGFSSPAYFSRYVQRNLGVNPSEYRDK